MKKKIKKIKVFVGLSGGVDSSVTALLLQKAGYDVTGVFIRSYNLDGCAERDAVDARLTANHLGIPFYVFDFEKEYKHDVVDYMIQGYRSGLTPNPDVMCNKYIKFGMFLKKARALGADYIATGHYVRLRNAKKYENKKNKSKNDSYIRKPLVFHSLLQSKDSNKDQSYFLWTLNQDQLQYCLFPIGDYLKSEVRAIARKAGLPTAKKKDSQGICFLGKVAVSDFLKDYIPAKRGAVLTTTGRIIGEHEGVQFYTIGQRHGLDLKSKNRELGIRGREATPPHYIAAKDSVTNTLVVAEGDDNPALFKKELELSDVSFVNPMIYNSKFPISVMARVRYRQPLAKARMYKLKTENYRLVFAEKQKFVASGQSAVFYSARSKKQHSGREMIGGGIIC